MRRRSLAVTLGLALVVGVAQAQMYRWVDGQGRVFYSDRPPPPSAKSAEKKKLGSSVIETSAAPFELQRAMKISPVTLYTSPTCKEACSQARAALNARGVPFKEVQVWNEETNLELRQISGGNEVPVLIVGRDMHKGFLQSGYDELLDLAGYPKAGTLPPRKQADISRPEGYLTPAEREAQKAQTEPTPPPEEPRPTGPYAPRFSTQ
jgi:glutaredoxin